MFNYRLIYAFNIPLLDSFLMTNKEFVHFLFNDTMHSCYKASSLKNKYSITMPRRVFVSNTISDVAEREQCDNEV